MALSQELDDTRPVQVSGNLEDLLLDTIRETQANNLPFTLPGLSPLVVRCHAGLDTQLSGLTPIDTGRDCGSSCRERGADEATWKQTARLPALPIRRMRTHCA
jgi:hypothetical protein